MRFVVSRYLYRRYKCADMARGYVEFSGVELLLLSFFSYRVRGGVGIIVGVVERRGCGFKYVCSFCVSCVIWR